MKKVLITGGSGTVGSSFIKNYYDDYKFWGHIGKITRMYYIKNQKDFYSLYQVYLGIYSGRYFLSLLSFQIWRAWTSYHHTNQ